MTIAQTGRTMRQMLNAPLDCFYVWGSDSLDYPRSLAAHLGRKDIVFTVARYISPQSMRPIVVDHAAKLIESTWDVVIKVNEREIHNLHIGANTHE